MIAVFVNLLCLGLVIVFVLCGLVCLYCCVIVNSVD